MFFDYGPTAPYMWYGVVSAEGVLKHYVPVPLPGARMPHDMWITDKHTILMDLPLYADPRIQAEGRHKLTFNRDIPSRFAVIPRFGGPRTSSGLRPNLVTSITRSTPGRRRRDRSRLLSTQTTQTPKPTDHRATRVSSRISRPRRPLLPLPIQSSNRQEH